MAIIAVPTTIAPKTTGYHPRPIQDSLSQLYKGSVKSLAKGLEILKLFNIYQQMTINDIAQSIQMDRAGARRFALTLRDIGYLEKQGNVFILTPNVLELGYSYFANQNWIHLLIPYLKKLNHQFGETFTIAVESGDDIIYVAREATQHLMGFTVSIGSRLPLFCTAHGRAILSGLEKKELEVRLKTMKLVKLTKHTLINRNNLVNEILKVKKQGYAIVKSEVEEDLISLAFPLYDHNGKIFAGINIGGHCSRLTKQKLNKEVVPIFKKTVVEIESVVKKVGFHIKIDQINP